MIHIEFYIHREGSPSIPLQHVKLNLNHFEDFVNFAKYYQSSLTFSYHKHLRFKDRVIREGTLLEFAEILGDFVQNPSETIL